MVVAYLAVGSNVGDRVVFCRSAIEALRDHPEIEVDATSSLYETSPVGVPPQRSFVNMAVRIHTSLDARALLDAVKKIERQLGREPNEMRWGPRVVDLDIMTFDEEKIVEPDLEIPHPRLRQRRFMLVSLLEIDPDAADPWGSRYADALDEAEGEVELLEAF